MHPMLNIAIRAARKAGNHIAKSLENADKIESTQKGSNDFVTNVDKEAEALIIDTIKSSYPEHCIVAEENGLIEGKDKDVQWIIDPLDGTTNFVKGLPHFSVSIAVRMKGKTEVACVYDPMLNELFTAQRGAGAQLNNARIRVPQLKDLQGAVLATGFPFKQKQHSESYMKIVSALFVECADFRRTGSAALDLCYLAAGRVDGFFELGLKPWDMAAGELIAREAGAILTDFSGGTNYMQSGNIVGSSPRGVKSILKHIRENGNEAILK
ncbi:Inositol-1-monophosphatase [Vibrio nigripulchritudo MADA3029]|uniref:Inositol-1-monophosphatase n=2 Tax=Vibrio nigripulchritudo TaxID=28173 RepID=U4K8B9_9VIBR|nr:MULTISPECIES: inositol-1-monophosphatase [Vibrio]EGU59829.1 inositol monophosphate family protein [Vibrio nigripulchritudo ATCC 27043]KJY80094.1 inositol monophosphatase [Vibrio nigripulchritudo]UAB69720.1 inositol-1-monophosphatase [Vibrio sp. SCSIO 43132]CCN35810.1 Inositol-1-monophosphatase [Vibrio nigripulchritudo AM115]CCN39207.1 Inositol-1-monophosphatase [Vibrio nigripulchritudo FTn2]